MPRTALPLAAGAPAAPAAAGSILLLAPRSILVQSIDALTDHLTELDQRRHAASAALAAAQAALAAYDAAQPHTAPLPPSTAASPPAAPATVPAGRVLSRAAGYNRVVVLHAAGATAAEIATAVDAEIHDVATSLSHAYAEGHLILDSACDGAGCPDCLDSGAVTVPQPGGRIGTFIRSIAAADPTLSYTEAAAAARTADPTISKSAAAAAVRELRGMPR